MLPPEFDAAIYRELHADLRNKNDEQLRSHYRHYGLEEGRRCHALGNRSAFVGLIAPDADVLEIGPFANPLVRGARVRYLDVLGSRDLAARAREVGYDPERVPEIHFVAQDGDLGIVPAGSFDVVLSSHVIEHQPNLVGHLQAVQRVLRDGGQYFLLVPDKRYCFDHYQALSTIADVMEAHEAKRRVHTLRSVIADRVLTTHNDERRHWQGDHGVGQNVAERLREALEMYQRNRARYLDVHAWYFVPASFRQLLELMAEVDLIRLEVTRLYPTLAGNNEFWAVLRKRPS